MRINNNAPTPCLVSAPSFTDSCTQDNQICTNQYVMSSGCWDISSVSLKLSIMPIALCRKENDHRRGLRTMMISPPPRPPWQHWSSKSPLLCTSLMTCEFTIMMAIMSCTNQSLTFIQHENALYAKMQIISKCCKSHTNHCSPWWCPDSSERYRKCAP